MLSVGVVYKCTDVICVYLLTYLYIHVREWVCVCVRVNLIHECVQKLPIVASWCWVFASLVEDAVTPTPHGSVVQSEYHRFYHSFWKEVFSFIFTGKLIRYFYLDRKGRKIVSKLFYLANEKPKSIQTGHLSGEGRRLF